MICVGPLGSVIGQGDDVVLDALVLQLLHVFRHCLLRAKQALGLGHGSISHRCDSRVCCSLKLSLCDQLLAWGYRHILDLGLLEEWGSLFILDVSDLALLYLDVVAIRDHNIFLGQQVLDTILRDDILYLVVRGHQVLDHLTIRCGDLLDISGFFLIGHCLFLGHNNVFLAQGLL